MRRRDGSGGGGRSRRGGAGRRVRGRRDRRLRPCPHCSPRARPTKNRSASAGETGRDRARGGLYSLSGGTLVSDAGRGYILALDQGTTGSAALVFDRRGAPVAMADREIRQGYPEPGWVEHDPEEIYRDHAPGGPRGAGRRRYLRPRPRGDRHHQPARDDRHLGPQDRPADRAGRRLAVPAQHADLPAAQAGRPGADRPGAHGPADRRLLLGDARSPGCSTTCRVRASAPRPASWRSGRSTPGCSGS